MTTLTVLLEDSGQTQTELQSKLGALVRSLELSDSSEAIVQPVFPGETSGRWKATFVVIVSGRGRKLAKLLSAMPGVAQAYVAPSRSSA